MRFTHAATYGGALELADARSSDMLRCTFRSERWSNEATARTETETETHRHTDAQTHRHTDTHNRGVGQTHDDVLLPRERSDTQKANSECKG